MKTFPVVTNPAPAVRRWGVLFAAATMTFAAAPPAGATELPRTCAAASCGATGPTAFVTQGSASLSATATKLTVTQASTSAVLNWSNFNISADGTVTFVQPNASSIAINRIFQSDATKIFGSLNSNGTVYLLNQNGFLFGRTAVVNVGGLVASSLNISDSALNLGIGGASANTSPAFLPYVDAGGHALKSGDVLVQNGAAITSNGGQVFLFAPNVENGGTISTPDGQTILGAGQRIFLAASTDPNVRGLLIEVGTGGTVTNDGASGAAGGMGQLIANRGNVTLAGLAVNQAGRVSATTTTRANGSILLQARDTPASQLSTPGRLQYSEMGTLTLGPGSVTEVTLEGSASDTAVDVTAQPKSLVTMSGATVLLESAAQVTATSGNVTITATTHPGVTSAVPDTSRIWMAPDSVIDVSGANIQESVSDNSLAVQLRGSEFADNPAQRNGALRGLTAYVDIRNYGVDANGNAWVGTPIANLLGDVSTLRRDVFQRNLTGGTVTMTTSGSFIQSPSATVNVSGGSIDWQSGYVKSSVLLGSNGVAYNIASADPNGVYVGTLDSISLSDPHWGTAASVASFGRDPRGVWTPGYVEGKDAGSVTVIAPSVIFDGALLGDVTVGPYQRLPATTVASGQLYRAYNQVPLGGQLILGNAGALSDTLQTEVLTALSFQPTSVLATLTGPNGGAFDPARDPLPAGFVSDLSPAMLQSGGMSRVAVYADGIVALPVGQTLAMGAGGSLTIGAGRVLIGGAITVPGGSVSLSAVPTVVYNGDLNLPLPGIYALGSGSISAGGEWVNDSPILAGAQPSPLFTSGGQVTLASTSGSLYLPAGFAIDVSGGAQATVAGAIVPGRGGTITISDKPGNYYGNAATTTVFDPSLSGYALANGGTLSIGLGAVCVTSLSCSDPLAVAISPGLLTNNGFANVTLKSTASGLEVLADVNLSLAQQNLQLDPGVIAAPSAVSLYGLATPVLLPVWQRVPESLTLASTAPINPDAPHSSLVIAAGASITTDPLGSITARTDSRIIDDGKLVAPGGQVTLDVVPSSLGFGYVADQGLWLGAGAVIDVSGTTVYTPNTLGLDLGKVLPGGSISLLAENGYLIAAAGAELDARGAVGTLDLRRSTSNPTYQRLDVASAGGSISLFGAEGIQFDSTMHADGGGAGSATGAVAAGGTLSVSVNGDLGNGSSRSIVSFPSTPRVLTITTAEAPVVVPEGGAVPFALNGQGRISASLINAGGFDQLHFSAGNLLGNNGGPTYTVALGSVAFESGVSLNPAISLTVNAGDLHGLGSGTVTLSSPYVALGSSDILTQSISTVPAAGPAQLLVTAGLLDLNGSFTLSGYSAETLQSAGDIRAIGVQTAGGTSYAGHMISGGALTLDAQQIYPVSLTTYSIQASTTDPVLGRMTIGTMPGTAGAVLSAAGTLNLTAMQIDDSGVIRAPFGTIGLSAGVVNLEAGSVTSVSGSGQNVIFGETQGGLDWIYPVNPTVTQVYGVAAGDLLPPQKAVNVSAATFNLQKGAVIDVSGGGDLTAFEFTAGTGGTRDVLSNFVSPNLYAVLPGAQLAAAPVDPLNGQGFTLQPGSSVYLAGGGGLAAGTYTLLPARYALLPGAFLVKAVPGYTNLAQGVTLGQLDGSVIVAGYLTAGVTGRGATQTSGFDVMPGSYALQEASYALTSANTFFAGEAQAVGVAPPRLPMDAGSISINATVAAALAGAVDTTHGASGSRGAAIDLSSANLYVSSNAATAPAGYVTLDPTQLDALGAESLLLGGVRVASASGTTLNVGAANVIVAPFATLSGQEILLAGSSSVQLEATSAVNASGAAVAVGGALTMPAGTALLRASTGAQQNVLVSGSGGSGAIIVASGATVAATGSVTFNSGGVVDFEGALQASGASVRLGSTLIGVGPTPTGFAGLALTPALLAGLNSANLELASPNPIEFFGSTSLTLQRLALVAPGLVAETPGAQLTVTAGDVVLGGPAATPVVVSSGTGSFDVLASTVELSGGTFGVSAVIGSTVTASTAVVGNADATFATAGNLSVTTPVLSTRGAFNVGLAAIGTLTLANVAATSGSSAPVPVAGGALSLSGSSVSLDTSVRLPAGQLLATATAGSVILGGHALVDVSGFSKTFDGVTVSAPGGLVSLVATGGDVTLDPGASVDVSAGQGTGAGGSVVLAATSGSVSLGGHFAGAGAVGQSGASLSVDAAHVDVASVLAVDTAAGFTGDLSLRLRGAGDIVVGSGTTLRNGNVSMTADQGAITVAGAIDASGPTGHTVTLAALGDVRVDGSIRADATASATRGGTVNLLSATGGVYLGAASSLAVGGTSGSGSASVATDTGTVWIRAPRSAVDSVLNSDPTTRQIVLGGTIGGASGVTVEGYQSYATGGVITYAIESPDPSNPVYADAAAFMANATALDTALGRSGQPPVSVIPGVELTAPGDLHLASAWDLSTWRFGDLGLTPGALTLRAGGSLYIDQSLSDGFQGLDPYSGFYLIPGFGQSWSYRLVAGADFGSSQPLAVTSPVNLAPGAGNVIVAPGTPSNPTTVNAPTVVRTGTGFIDIAAARDLTLSNQASVIYTAGTASPDGLPVYDTVDSGFQGLAYPTAGGNVSITVGRDVVGAVSNQLFVDWLWRSGTSVASPAGYVPAAWMVSYGNFEQGIGAFGGGDLTVVAGRDVVNLGANVPTTGVPVGDGTPTGTTTQVWGSGLLSVTAGRNIVGGKYLGMAAGAALTAGGGTSLGAPTGNAPGTYPILSLGGDVFSLTTRRDLTIEAVVNPTLLNRSALQPVVDPIAAELYATYTDQSAVDLVSTGGNVVLANRNNATDPMARSLAYDYFNGFAYPYTPALATYAPNLSATSLAGNLVIQGNMDLWPSPHGTLDLLAANSVIVATNSGHGAIHISQSDLSPAFLGTPDQPGSSLGNFDLIDVNSYYTPGSHAPAPVHGGAYASDGLPDAVPNRVVALNGDVSVMANDIANFSLLLSAKPIDIVAGRDIVNLGLNVQNFAAGNVDQVIAGRDIIYLAGRSSTGLLEQNLRTVDVSGPGELLVQAGRNVNLQTSYGITSSGNLDNSALPAGGADISVIAGVASGPQYSAFVDTYLVNSSIYDNQLMQFIQGLTGAAPASKAAALAAFKALGAPEQAGFLETLFIDELRAGGRSAAAAGPGHNDFTRAFTALETLFPGANPNLAANQVNPYQGDILLYFSRIYTLAGGNIDLYAPGGQINVGLAAAPSTFGITKTPAQLGIVAQSTGSVSAVAYSDVQVNQSRIFAADGGNILIWSTEGNIDAGRGAKTAISAPPPLIRIDANGQVTSIFPAALTGSGIQTIASTVGTLPGDVDLYAPHGVVNTNDAGIVAGNLTIAATAVLGSNFTFSGTAVGVPVVPTGLGASLAAAASSGTAASSLGTNSVESGDRAGSRAPMADTALNWLEVFVVGLGDDVCRPDDLECLRRQRHN